MYLPNKVMDQFNGLTQHVSDMISLWSNLVISNIQQATKSSQSYFELYQQQLSLFLFNPTELNYALLEYAIDLTQRNIIFWDIIRKRGNQYLEHVAAGQPPVLIFKYKMIIDGRKFERPVNYALVEIEPPKGIKINKNKRPYVIVDPRAGHGSGIGGFKDDSQVGVALRAGHPVYFVIFFPEPEPGQVLHDITIAEEKFLREVAHRHPKSPKPCVIGNCQGGWAAMALAAAHPDSAGVVVINGAPMSYWAGENGKNPMRYTGGIIGGSWPAQFAGDLGNGKFDGAHLVMNFEWLNPNDNYWKKYYNLFTKVDSEEQRYLAFERWWGGFTLLNSREMRSIVDNLFIGNKLAHGKIPIDQHSNIDLRNIQLPIIIFCSQGDNITPPQQALNWIADIYPDVLELKLARQVIVYIVHQTVGHLGIFVSGHVVKTVHGQIIDLLNYVEHLPPGLYEMIIDEEKNPKSKEISYSIRLEERTIEDIRKTTNKQHQKDEELFNIVRVVSDFNATAYDFGMSPWIRLAANEYFANLLRELHPMRMSRYLLSDMHPLLLYLSNVAPVIRANRKTVSVSNPLLILQHAYSKAISEYLETMRLIRDTGVEFLFYWIYGTAHTILPHDLPFREGIVRGANEIKETELDQHILSTIEEGQPAHAIIRILLLLIKSGGLPKGAHISKGIKKLKESTAFYQVTDFEFRSIVHTQTLIVEYDPELALNTLPQLLKTKQSRKQTLSTVNYALSGIDTLLSVKAQKFLVKINNLLK